MAEEINGIHVPITFDVDVSGITESNKELDQMHQKIDNMPNLGMLTQQAVDAAKYVSTIATDRYSKSYDMKFESSRDREQYITRTNSAARDYNAIADLLKSNSSPFSLKMEHDMLSGISDSLQKALDATIPTIADVIKTKMNVNYRGVDAIRSNDSKTIARTYLRQDADVRKALAPVMEMSEFKSLDKGFLNKFLENIVVRAAPAFSLDEYSRKRYGHAVSRSEQMMQMKPTDFIPKSFLQSFENKGYSRRTFTPEQMSQVLSQDSVDVIRHALKTNNSAVTAALTSGIATRNQRGELQVLQNITREQNEDFREALYKQLEVNATGVSKVRYGKSIYDLAEPNQTSRLSNGVTHRLLRTMEELEKLEDASAWTDTITPGKTYRRAEEARRQAKAYETKKYMPFIEDPSGKMSFKHVSMNESQITRMLGLGNRDAYSDISDAIATIGLSGYDSKNKQHRKQLEDIFEYGVNLDGKWFDAITSHRDPKEGVSIRLVAREAREKMEQEYASIAEALGLDSKQILSMFEGTNGFDSLTQFRKHMDALNKMFTGSYDIGADLKNARIAVVDSSYKDASGKKINPEDGVGWASGRILPHSIQTRFGLGGKGSLISLTSEDQSLRDYYINSGMATKTDVNGNPTQDYHVWRKGPNGQMMDIIDSDMVLDLSLIKNLGMLKDNDGKWLSNEAISDRMRGVIGLMTGLAAVADYDDEKKTSNRLGAQAMSFMTIPKAVQEMQMSGLRNRMAALQTEAGIKKYIFSDADNDWLSGQVDKNTGSFINSPEVQKRISAYISSLALDIAGGNLIDWGYDPHSSISRARIITNPLNSHYQTAQSLRDKGFDMDKAKKAIRSAVSKMDNKDEMYKEYKDMSDTELEKIITDTLTLNEGTAIDYKHLKNRQIGIVRSPTGLGNYVHVKNRAREMQILNEALGLKLQETEDVLVGTKDLETLQGADKDGDEVKVLIGKYADMVKASADEYKKQIERAGVIKPVDDKELGANLHIAGNSYKAKADDAEAKLKESMLMGSADAIGRAMNLYGLSDENSGNRIAASLRSQALYNIFSTYAKKPVNPDQLTTDDFSALFTGREYGKFTNKMESLFHFDDDMYKSVEYFDAHGKKQTKRELDIENPDVYFDKQTGEKINLRAIKSMNLNKINLPSMLNQNEAMAREMSGILWAAGGNKGEADLVNRALTYYGTEYQNNEEQAGAGEATKRFMNAMNKLRFQFTTGRMFISGEEEALMESLEAMAQQEIATQAKKIRESNGKFLKDDGTEFQGDNAESNWIKQQERKYGVGKARNAINEFGPTESRISEIMGEEKLAAEKILQGTRFWLDDSDYNYVAAARGELPESPQETQDQREEIKKRKPAQTRAKSGRPKKSAAKQKAAEVDEKAQKEAEEVQKELDYASNAVLEMLRQSGMDEKEVKQKADQLLKGDAMEGVLPKDVIDKIGGNLQMLVDGYNDEKKKLESITQQADKTLDESKPKTQTRKTTVNKVAETPVDAEAEAAKAGALMSINQLLDQTKEFSNALRAPMYKDKEQSYSENFFDKEQHMFESVNGQITSLLNQKDNKMIYTKDKKTGDLKLTDLGARLEHEQGILGWSYRKGTEAFAKQRSNSILDKMRKDYTQAPDIDAVYDTILNYQNLEKEHGILAQRYLETRAHPNSLSPAEAAIYRQLQSHDASVQDLSAKNQENVFNKYRDSFQKETDQIDDILAAQQREKFAEELNKSSASLLNNAIISRMNERVKRQNTVDELGDRVSDKELKLQGYEIERRNNENDLKATLAEINARRSDINRSNYSAEQKLVKNAELDKEVTEAQDKAALKTKILDAAIEKTTEQVSKLKEAFDTAKASLDKLGESETFNALGKDIEGATSQFKNIANGTKSSSFLSQLSVIDDTVASAKIANDKLAADAGILDANGNVDYSKTDKISAIQNYISNFDKIANLEKESGSAFKSMMNENLDNHNALMAKLGVGLDSPIEGIRQAYNSRIESIAAYIAQCNAEMEEAQKQIDGSTDQTYINERNQYINQLKANIADATRVNSEVVKDYNARAFQTRNAQLDARLRQQEYEAEDRYAAKNMPGSLIARDVTSLFRNQDAQQLAVENAQRELDAATAAQAAYIKQYEELQKKVETSGREGLTKKQQTAFDTLPASIQQANTEVEKLTQSLQNLKAALNEISGANGFDILQNSIGKATNQLQKMVKGVRSSPIVSQVAAIADTIATAEMADQKMAMRSPYYNNGDWDYTTPEGIAAINQFVNGSDATRNLKATRTDLYDYILNSDARQHEAFSRSFTQGILPVSPWEQIAQQYNGKDLMAQERIAQLKFNAGEFRTQAAKYDAESEEAKLLNALAARYDTSAANVLNQNNVLQGLRDTDIARAQDSATFKQQMRSRQIDLNNKYGQQAYENQMFNLNNRALQYTMFGRELSSIRGIRQGAEKQYDNFETQYKNTQEDIKNLKAERQKIIDSTPAGRRQDTKALQLNEAKIADAEKQAAGLTERMKEQQSIMDRYPASADIVNAAMNTIQMSMVRLGTQIFRKAIQEAKQFVQQFDASMTEIQMVTLKSDAEINNLGDGLIKKAVQLKASVKEVTTAATALYRQGLDDEEVDDRLTNIIKFTKVGNVKAEDATKLATVAVNGGMVDSAQEIFDIVSAISDNAATDASAITKGLQKSMYAAKAVGVTADELVSMLAVITSKTQLSGQVAGTTMATVFSRLQRLNENDIVYDENGQASSGSDLANALKLANVDLYRGGKMRSAYDVLSDLGNAWGGLNDTTKGVISYRLGGGRQASNLQALMEGFTEVDESGRRLIDTFKELADSSHDLVDTKYESYAKSLAGVQTELKSSFDMMINSFADTGSYKSLLGFVTESIQGFTELNNVLGPIPVAIVAIATAVSLLAATPAGGIMTLVGTIAGLGLAIGKLANENLKDFQKNQFAKTFEGKTNTAYDNLEKRAGLADKAYRNANELNERRLKGQTLSLEEENSLQASMRQLESLGYLKDLPKDAQGVSQSFGEVVSSARLTAEALNGLKGAVEDDIGERATRDLALLLGEDRNAAHQRYQKEKSPLPTDAEILDALRPDLEFPDFFYDEKTWKQQSTKLANIIPRLTAAGFMTNVSIEGLEKPLHEYTQEELSKAFGRELVLPGQRAGHWIADDIRELMLDMFIDDDGKIINGLLSDASSAFAAEKEWNITELDDALKRLGDVHGYNMRDDKTRKQALDLMQSTIDVRNSVGENGYDVLRGYLWDDNKQTITKRKIHDYLFANELAYTPRSASAAANTSVSDIFKATSSQYESDMQEGGKLFPITAAQALLSLVRNPDETEEQFNSRWIAAGFNNGIEAMMKSGNYKDLTTLWRGLFDEEGNTIATQKDRDAITAYLQGLDFRTEGLYGEKTDRTKAYRANDYFTKLLNGSILSLETLEANATKQEDAFGIMKDVFGKSALHDFGTLFKNQKNPWVELNRQHAFRTANVFGTNEAMYTKAQQDKLSKAYVTGFLDPEKYVNMQDQISEDLQKVMTDNLSDQAKTAIAAIQAYRSQGDISGYTEETIKQYEYELQMYLNDITDLYTNAQITALAQQGLSILTNQETDNAAKYSQYTEFTKNLTEAQREELNDMFPDLESLAAHIGNGEEQSVIDEEVNGIEEEIMRYILAEFEWAEDAIKYSSGLKSNSFATQLSTVNEMIERADQMASVSKYTTGLVNTGYASDEGYSALSSALGLDTSILRRLGRSDKGKSAIKSYVDKMNETSSQAIVNGLFSLLSEETRTAITNAGDNINNEQLVDIIQNSVDEGLAELFRLLGITVKDGIKRVDVDTINGTESIQTVLNDYETQWENTNKAGRMEKVLNALGINDLSAGDEETRRNTFLSMINDPNSELYADEELRKMFGEGGTLTWATIALQNRQISMNDMAMYAKHEINPYSAKDTAYYNPAIDYMLSEAQNLMTHGDYSGALQALNQQWDYANSSKGGIVGQQFAAMFNEFSSESGSGLIDVLNNSEDAFYKTEDGAKAAEGALKKFFAYFSSQQIKELEAGKEHIDEAAESLENMKGSAGGAAEVSGKFVKDLYDLADAQAALTDVQNKGAKASKKSKQLLGQLSKTFDEDDIDRILKKGTDVEKDALFNSLSFDVGGMQTKLETQVEAQLDDLVKNLPADITLPEIGVDMETGEVDLSKLIAWLRTIDAEWSKTVADNLLALQGKGGTVKFDTKAIENGLEGVTDVKLNNLSGGGGGRRGGGSKDSSKDNTKSSTDRLLEKVKYGGNLFEHRKNMIHYEQTKYENRGQLTMYGKALQKEISLNKGYLPALRQNISALKAQMKEVKKGSDDWYKLRDALFSAEEKLKDVKNNIEELTKQIRENKKAILEVRTNMEETIRQEIENRIQQQRDMLEGTTSMEETILNAIKSRYQDEWDLMKKDIEKKKQALSDEKALIDERLNKRKQAEDEAAKYEELAELKSQYANISMDESRSKDAAELRKRIQDIEKDIGWQIAEKETQIQTDAIQDQIDAYDSFMSNGDENMSDYLEDANNFAMEVNRVLSMNKEEMIEWLAANDQDYANSLANTRKQIEQGWEDTFKQMKGIVDTYWNEINKILSNDNAFVAFMQQSADYQNASSTDKTLMQMNWIDSFKDLVNAFKNLGKVELHVTNTEGDYKADEYSITTTKNASGGEADFTGLTWVDGTFTQPERILSAYQTELFDKMVGILEDINRNGLVDTLGKMTNWSQNAFVAPKITPIDSTNIENNVTTVGDIIITLNEAKLQDDADYYEVASRVGQVFAKELSKQGIRTAFNF